MKRLIALIALTISTAAVAQESIKVYLGPSTDAPQIGSLEAISLAVPAEWPANSKSTNGWQPVYYRGAWEVYVDNNDIAKDLSAKPGSAYLLAPEKGATKLSIATTKDKVEIVSVDTWFCKMQLETILLGYISSSTATPQPVANALPTSTVNAGDPATISELRGTLATTGIVAKTRTGLSYKLNNDNGKALALLDLSELPERIQIKDLVGSKLSVTGTFTQNSNGATVILAVQNLSKTN